MLRTRWTKLTLRSNAADKGLATQTLGYASAMLAGVDLGVRKDLAPIIAMAGEFA